MGGRRARRRLGTQRGAQARQGLASAGAPGGDRGDAHKRCGAAPGVALNRASILFAAVPDKHAQAQVQVHRSTGMIPGAFEGETVTRRRFMTVGANGAGVIAAASFALPALGFALGPIFKSTPHHWETVGPVDDFTDRQLRPGGHHARRRASARPARRPSYMRKLNPTIDTDRYDRDTPFIAISSRCAHLGCPVRWVDAAERFICPCHGGVYDLLGRARRRAAGAPARPLLHARERRSGAGRPALQRQQRAATASRRATPASRSTASASTSTRRGPTRAGTARADDVPEAASPPAPGRAEGAAAAPGRAATARPGPLEHAKEAGITVVDWVDERTSLSGAARWLMFRKVPEGHQLVLHARLGDDVRLPLPGRHGRVPGDVLPPRPAGGAYESIRHVTNEVFLGQFVRGMHKWGSSVMVILVFLHMGRTFFFGAYKYPRELNWVIGVVLLILTMVMSFTGYLLPFDQRAYWATIVGVNINGTGPLLGPYLSDFLRGGPGIRGDDAVALLCDPHAAGPGR